MSRSIRVLVGAIAFLILILALVQMPGTPGPAYAAKPTPTPQPTPLPPPDEIPAGLRAGLRASNYGITPWPSPTWWVDSINDMASRWPGSVGEQIAVVVEVAGGGGRNNCWAHFPEPATGGPWPSVNWDDIDLFEPVFDAFDAAGIMVWLQVEPARCDVAMLIDLLYQQYGHHSSVIGFGVDVEWYRKDLARFGKPVTDAEAQAWLADIRSQTPDSADDLLFLKHWLIEKMPENARDGHRVHRRQPGARLAGQHGRRVHGMGPGVRGG